MDPTDHRYVDGHRWDRLSLCGRLGAGGMGEVYLAEADGMQVAVKLLKADGSHEARMHRALWSEARAMVGLHHPHIVSLLGVGVVTATGNMPERAGSPYLVMDYVPGPSMLSRQPRNAGTFLRMLRSILSALAHAHAHGVVHRDLKLSNVLIDMDRSTIKLVDFGLAWAMAEASSGTSLGAGTARYMAPEQFLLDGRSFGPWTDLYSLAAVCWKILCGRPLFAEQGATDHDVSSWRDAHLWQELPTLRPRFALPPGVEELLRWMLAKDPGARPPCAAAALAEIDRIEGRGAPDRGWRQADVAPQQRGWDALRLQTAGELPLVGRTAHRDGLWDALNDTVDQGTGRVVVLSGPAGAGKTRLARWLRRSAHELGRAQVLEATYGETLGARDGLRAMFFRHFGLSGLDHTDADEQLAVRIANRPVWEGDRIRESLGLHMAEGEAAPSQRQWLSLLDLLAKDGPVLVVLDDAHRSYEALGLCEAIAGRGAPILVVATVTPDEVVANDALRDTLRDLSERQAVQVLAVPMLDRRDFGRLVTALAPASESLVEALWERTRGHVEVATPTLLEWADRGLLVHDGDGWRVQDHPDEVRAPERLWADRVEQAAQDAEERVALAVAALLGPRVDEGEWQAACAGLGVTVPCDLVERLEWSGLVTWSRTSRSFAFAHGAVRDAAAALLDPMAAADAHRAIARLLQARRDPWTAQRRADHRLRAGDRRAALGDLLQLAFLLVSEGDGGAARRVVAHADVVARSLPEGAGGEAHARVRLMAAHAAYVCGDHELALVEAGAVARVADASELPDLYCRARGFVASILHELGRRDEALQEVFGVLDRARIEGLGAVMPIAHSRIGALLCEVGHVEPALPHLEAARRLAPRGSMVRLIAISRLAQARLAQGDVAAASALSPEILQEGHDVGDATAWAFAWCAAADVRWGEGRLVEAWDCYATALHRLEASSPLAVELRCRVALLALDVAPDEAPDRLAEVLAVPSHPRLAGVRALAHLGLAVLAAQGAAWDRVADELAASRAAATGEVWLVDRLRTRLHQLASRSQAAQARTIVATIESRAA